MATRIGLKKLAVAFLRNSNKKSFIKIGKINNNLLVFKQVRLVSSKVANSRIDVIATPKTMGGPGAFTDNQFNNQQLQLEHVTQGKIVREISGVWAESGRSENRFRGVEFIFNDGSSQVIGNTDGARGGSIKFDVESGERITELKLYVNGSNRDLPFGFEIHTNKGQSYLGGREGQASGEYNIDVGCGILLGAFGSQQDGVNFDRFGFYMLRKLATDRSFFLTNLDYNLNVIPPPQVDNIISTQLANDTNLDSDSGYTRKTYTHQNEGSWSITNGTTFGEKIGVKAGSPELTGASIEGEVSWTQSEEKTTSTSFSDTETLEISIPLFAPALTKTQIDVLCYTGPTTKVPYDADLLFVLDNGREFRTGVTGFYEGRSTTQITQNTVKLADYVDGRWIDVRDPVAQKSIPAVKRIA